MQFRPRAAHAPPEKGKLLALCLTSFLSSRRDASDAAGRAYFPSLGALHIPPYPTRNQKPLNPKEGGFELEFRV